MNQFIVGAGIVTENIANLSYLLDNNIDQLDIMAPKNKGSEYLNKSWGFQSKAVIAREDRALLNKIAQLAIDASMQAMEMAESTQTYNMGDKQDFPIFSTTEMMDYDLSSLDKLLEDNSYDVEISLKQLGELKKYFNPLDMLRLLSTNPLYHLSKVFGLQGGGYPIRKMSLSSLCALELACLTMNTRQSRALVTSVGNLGMAENLTAFIKMGLLRTAATDNGIIPAYGAASLVVESQLNADLRNPLAEILTVKSRYHNKSLVTEQDWLTLYNKIDILNEQLYVIYYNNGVQALFEAEKKAVAQRFPQAICYSYKPYIGYTGKSNNLIDLIIAVTDKRIPKNSLVLINGIGTAVGLGCILLKKCWDI